MQTSEMMPASTDDTRAKRRSQRQGTEGCTHVLERCGRARRVRPLVGGLAGTGRGCSLELIGLQRERRTLRRQLIARGLQTRAARLNLNSDE